AFVAALVPLLVVLVTAPAGPADARPAEPAYRGIPRTYDAALAHFNLVNDIRAVRKFVTPSGNIYCHIGGRGPKGCEISVGAVKDPDVCSGVPVADRVGRIEFRRGRAIPVCNTDTIRKPGARVLPYGAATKFGRFACLSERQGVTCIHLKRTEGFFLHKGEYVIFNAG
ncbi:MAG TPA: hypothetical protein PLZ93_19650, partial [Nocardioides sp.]|nr:hypothetical protein [Nocardioides sp.]